MIKINLNPEKRKKSEREFVSAVKVNKLLLYIGIPILMISLELIYMVYLNTRIEDLMRSKQDLIKERIRYKNIERKINQLKKAVAEAERLKETTKLKIAVFNKLASSKTDFIPMIKAIALSLPDGVWLKKMKIVQNGGNLTGFAFNPKYIANFYDNLSRYYGRINFSGVERKLSKNRNKSIRYYSFIFNLSNWKKESYKDGEIESGRK